MKYPRISIVIPSFNKVKYIQETLQSIVNQKYPNLEVIIQDGGSTDGTLEIIKKYAKGYPKIFSFVSKEDKGQTDAINTGLKKASGEIVSYINADDVYEKGALMAVGKYFTKNPGTLWLTGRGRVVDAKGREIVKPITLYKNLLLYLNSYFFLLISNYLMQPSVFLSQKAYKKHGPFTGNKYVMEYDLWLKIGRDSMPKVVNKTVSSFRLEGNTASLSLFNKILADDYRIIKKYSDNSLILFLHRIHNWARKTLAKGL